jgi:alpha-beta hydrolase superfamily lysophospholipase
MWRTAGRGTLWLIRTLALGLVVSVALLITGAVMWMTSGPELSLWHQVELDEEFTEDSDVESFADYLALEDRLFAQLEAKVVDQVPTGPAWSLNRYSRGSLSDPGRWPVNWNRSFELPVDRPRAGVLLLHGMSDAPYSLRSIGQRLQQAGAHVVGLRIPGHGTVSTGLVTTTWRDMAAATRIALDRVAEAVGNAPIFLIGYSNGGALAVQHALASLDDPEAVRPDGLVLLSPAIGVSPIAAFAVWQARLGWLLGVERLAWNSVGVEYEPFKYGGFAVNAGDQVFRITEEIRRLIDEANAQGRLQEFPPVLAFQSLVDATVSTPALVQGLFAHLPAEGDHELVLFDVNRRTEVLSLLRSDPADTFVPMLGDRKLTFEVCVVTNRTAETLLVRSVCREPGQLETTERPLKLAWPEDLYSLAHVALPFRDDDPFYGRRHPERSPAFQVGGLALRGERGALAIGASALLRLTWNPFYPYLEERALDFMGLAVEAPRAQP